jgi:hypothetical protein
VSVRGGGALGCEDKGGGEIELRRIQGSSKVASGEMRLLGMMAPPSVMIPARPPRWALDSSRLDPRVPTSNADRNRTHGNQDDQDTREGGTSVLRRGGESCVLWEGERTIWGNVYVVKNC